MLSSGGERNRPRRLASGATGVWNRCSARGESGRTQLGDRCSIARRRSVELRPSSSGIPGSDHDLCSGFKGVRVVGDAEWELNPAVTSDRLCHLEATAILVVEGEPVQAICQLSRKNYSESAIYAALRTHPVVLYEGQTYRNNPNYEAPRILENEPDLNHSEADALVLEKALARLSPWPPS